MEDINEAFERAISAGATVVDGISQYEFDGLDKDVVLDGEMAKNAKAVLMARFKDPMVFSGPSFLYQKHHQKGVWPVYWIRSSLLTSDVKHNFWLCSVVKFHLLYVKRSNF